MNEYKNDGENRFKKVMGKKVFDNKSVSGSVIWGIVNVILVAICCLFRMISIGLLLFIILIIVALANDILKKKSNTTEDTPKKKVNFADVIGLVLNIIVFLVYLTYSLLSLALEIKSVL